nr:MBL fold metallo-hydrolase [Granulicella arctica]
MIRASVEKLGFTWKDIKILLNSQAHADHMAGAAEVIRETHANIANSPSIHCPKFIRCGTKQRSVLGKRARCFRIACYPEALQSDCSSSGASIFYGDLPSLTRTSADCIKLGDYFGRDP